MRYECLGVETVRRSRSLGSGDDSTNKDDEHCGEHDSGDGHENRPAPSRPRSRSSDLSAEFPSSSMEEMDGLSSISMIKAVPS